MAALYDTKQNQDESNDLYLERFRSSINTVELARASNIFCSPELVQSVVKNIPTDAEIYVEEESSKAALF